jgi:hypothetical protein
VDLAYLDVIVEILKYSALGCQTPFFKKLIILTDNINNNFARFVEYEF